MPAAAVPPSLTDAVAAVRAFNRAWTRQIGVLDDHLLDTEFSLVEARVLYELAHRESPSPSEISAELGIDAGYLSRIIRRLTKAGLVKRVASRDDARRAHLSLSAAGRRAFARLDALQADAVAAMLGPVAPDQRDAVVAAMARIQRIMALPREGDRRTVVLRRARVSDYGWVIWRHGVLYSREFGWNDRFESLVARIVADFVEMHDPAREACWIAEVHGEPVGSIFLVQQSPTVAKLRLLLVEPSARGLGVGNALVDECMHTARALGYRTMTLWTQEGLTTATHIYVKRGFQLVVQEPHTMFGAPAVGQTWELTL